MENNLPTIKEKFEAEMAKNENNTDLGPMDTVEDKEIQDLKEELLDLVSDADYDVRAELDTLLYKAFREGVTAEKEFNRLCDEKEAADENAEFELTPEELKFVEGKADL